MRKLLNTTTSKAVATAAVAVALGLGGVAFTSKPAAAQIHAGVGIGPIGVGVNLGDRDHDGYWRDGYWHPDRDRVVVHDYGYPVTYDPAYPYGYYGPDGYSCSDPYSPYFDTHFCE